MNAISKLSPSHRTQLVLGAIGLVVGAGLGVAVARMEDAGAFDVSSLGWSDLLGGFLAFCFLTLALIMTVASFSPKAAGKMVDPGATRPASPAQASLVRQQALVMGLAGAMMAAPVAATALVGQIPPVLGSIVMLGIVAAFLAQTAYNLLIWRRADELMRNAISEAGAACFWILQGLLFLWAAAEKLGLAPALSSWDMMTLLMSFYLVVSSLVSMRRGLA